MQYLTVESLPKMRFAHIFGVDSYQYEFKPLHHTVEITYISKGQLHCVSDKEDFVLKQGDILFNAYLYPLRVEASEYHEHHTVSFQLEFGISDTTPTRVHQRLSQNNLRKRQISCEITAELSK